MLHEVLPEFSQFALPLPCNVSVGETSERHQSDRDGNVNHVNVDLYSAQTRNLYAAL